MAQRNAPARQQHTPPPPDTDTQQTAPPAGESPDPAQPDPAAAATAAQSDPAAGTPIDDVVMRRAKALIVQLPDRLLDQIRNDSGRALRQLPTEAAELLAEACYVFGINPDPTKKPLELAAFRFDAGNPNATNPEPAYVSLVTAGGWKGQYPINDDTEHKLRVALHAYRVNKNSGEREALPLPEDLTLPRPLVDGIVRAEDHVYQGGYLRSGGRDEAMRRAKLRELRDQGRIR